MQRTGTPGWTTLIRFALGLGLLGWMIGLAEAQFTEGPQVIDEFPKADDRIRLQELREKVSPSDDKDRKLLDKMAKYYAFRLTHEDLQKPQTDPKTPASGTVHGFLDEAFRTIVQPGQNDTQKQAYMNEYGKALATHLKKVVNNVQPITRINGARLLSQVAWGGSEEATDVLLDVLKNPDENDAAKFWALRGFRELFALKRPSKERESKYILALYQYLVQKAKTDQAMPFDEENGLRYVRREAVRALGQARFPAVVDGAKSEPVAWWLLKVACRDGIRPEAGLSEQFEAAFGVCQLDPKLAANYNLDYAAHQIGWFVVDFASAYQNSAGLPSPNAGIKFPWRIMAARLGEALDKFQASSAGNPSAKGITEIVRQCKLTLIPIEKDQSPKPNELENWLRGNPPTSTSLFKDQPETTIKAAINKG